MLVLQVVCNILLSMLLQGLSLVEEASSLTALYWNLMILATIYNLDSIPIGMCAIRHESFELTIEDSMSIHDVIKIL